MAVRLNVNINEETKAMLELHAAKRGTSVTEIVRRCVAVYDYVATEVDHGGDLVIEHAHGGRTRLEIL